jgi:gliding motility-associated-like protein
MKMLRGIFLSCAVFVAFATYAQCGKIELRQNETKVCIPSLVKFHLTHVPKGSKVDWTIDGTTVVSLDTFYYLVEKQGMFDVSALVTLPGGSTCTISKSNAVESHKLPVPQFQVSRHLLCNGPDTVMLKDNTPNVASRSWIVDGTNYNNASASLVHSFSTDGFKPVDLIVVDNNGCRNVLKVDSVIQIYKQPVFKIEADIHDGCQGQQIQFNVPASSRANVHSYSLSFDGASPSKVSNQSNPKISYNKAGQFDVHASIVTKVGCSYDYTFPKYINLGKAIDLKLTGIPTAGCLGDKITVIESNQSSEGSYWFDVDGADTANQQGSRIDLGLNDTGWVDIQVSYANNGCLSSKKFKKAFNVGAIKVDFSSNNNNHCLYPHTIDLNSKVNDYGSKAQSFQWNIIQDKKVVAQLSGPTAQFTSDSFGLYDVELEVTNDLGCKDKRVFTDFIRVQPMGIVVSAHSLIGCVGQNIDIVNSTPASTYQTTDEFSWTVFKDGKQVTTSKNKGLQINLSDTGYYDIQVYGDNSIGCRDTFFEKKAIRVINSEIGYRLPKQRICHGDSFTMIGESKPGNVAFSYTWIIRDQDGNTLHQNGGDSVVIKPEKAGLHNVVMYHQVGTGCKDSVIIENGLGVNILRAKILSDTTSGCPGMKVKPSIDPYVNLHHGSSNSDVDVIWSLFSNKPYTLDQSNGFPQFTLEESGYYQLKADVTNSMGCQIKVISDTLWVGSIADFEFDAPSFCTGDSIGVENQSTLKPTHFEWILPSFTQIDESGDQLRFTASKPGVYRVGMVASKKKICPDTAFREVEMIETVADFKTEDTLLFCAPVYAQFQSLSKFADSLQWEFGDGTSFITVDQNVANIYKTNLGKDEGFDVTLVARNKIGCSDTMVKKDLVFVTGPVPDFTVDKLTGCDTLDVKITNNSKEFAHLVMDYRDGSQTDTTSDLIHRYTHTVAGDESMTFRPRMIVTDESGCVATKELDTVITIHKGAQLFSLTFKHVEECVPFTVEANAGDYNANEAAWHFDGNTYNSKLVNLGFDEPGEYKLYYVGSNDLCTDTIEHTVVAKGLPIARIASRDTICKDSLTSFADGSKYVDGFGSNQWTIDGIEFKNHDEVFHTHETFGDKLITLEVVDKNGCVGRTEKTIKVPSPGEMTKPLVNYISYDEGDQIDVKIPSRTNSFVENTQLFHNGSFLQGLTSREQTDITFNYGGSPNCVYVVTQDYCDNTSEPSLEHCAIEIGSIPLDGAAQITWTAYQGWTGIERFSIYRSEDAIKYDLVGEVSGDERSYIDENLCPQTYYYKVIATDLEDRFTSSSRVTVVEPNYRFDAADVPVKYVTVVKNKAIEVAWDSTGYDEAGHFLVEKYDQNNVLFESAEVEGDRYLDKEAYVKNESYSYRVFYEDRCGLRSNPSRIGKSMRLRGYSNGYDKHLTWNHYKDWKTGVRFYKVQSKIDGEFTTIARLPGNVNKFKDTMLYESGIGEHCYRIVAISGNEKDSSYSNDACISGESKVMMPNAFSPNGDGLNDVFKPFGHYLNYPDQNDFVDYQFTVYNRHGQLVYRSEGNDHSGWDGTFNGKRCNPGVFIYHLTVIGSDGMVHHHPGTVTLIR